MEKRELRVSEEYLDELIKLHAARTVGVLMKRFELISDVKVLKSEVKEHIYESFRDFKELLKAHNKGLDVSQFNFQKPSSAQKGS